MTTSGDSHPLPWARRIAEELSASFAPACQRLVIAGSIRRERPFVSDIELVALPMYREEPVSLPQGDLFGSSLPPKRINLLWERIDELSSNNPREMMPIKPGVTGIAIDKKWDEKRIAGSRYFRLYLPKPKLKIDLFMADAATWGLVLAIRTGSATFSQALVTRWTAISRGGHAKDGLLVDLAGRVMPTPEEADVFRACRAAFVAPAARVDASSLVVARL